MIFLTNKSIGVIDYYDPVNWLVLNLIDIVVVNCDIN
jgi:hypothetical protein